jgi:hypothetical protein
MAKKTARKPTEQNISASSISITGVPLLDPYDSRHANQLARKLESTMKDAEAAIPLTPAIQLHALLIMFSRICQGASDECGMDEERPQYVN